MNTLRDFLTCGPESICFRAQHVLAEDDDDLWKDLVLSFDDDNKPPVPKMILLTVSSNDLVREDSQAVYLALVTLKKAATCIQFTV
jgi:hypothetical protein